MVKRNLVTGEVVAHVADAVVLAHGGRQRLLPFDERARIERHGNLSPVEAWLAAFGNPCSPNSPTCIPVSGDYQSKLTLMSESLRNDGRVWVPRKAGTPAASRDPGGGRDYYSAKYPSFGNLSPRDLASRAAKEVCDEGRGVGPGGRGVYRDFRRPRHAIGPKTIEERYGNLFEMYQRITDEDPYRVPMRIYPAVHYTMGGLWVDYDLMSTIPGLHVLGEANFSDHGANRLGASALMQGLADGYFIIPVTIGDYLATAKLERVTADHPEVRGALEGVAQKTKRLLSIAGSRTVDSFHRELGTLMWDKCGMARSAGGLREALRRIPEIRAEFWENVTVPGSDAELNQALEKANRVADFLELPS